MKHHIVATALMFGSALAHAQSAHWTFTYTGFYDQEAAVFLPDMQIAGSFTGTDANADGVLDLGELNSLTIGSMDYIACASGSNAYYHCGADRFTFSPNQGLSFSLGEYGSDPEGWRGGGHFVESGKMRYEYDFDPRTSTDAGGGPRRRRAVAPAAWKARISYVQRFDCFASHETGILSHAPTLNSRIGLQ
jgi:hypothetical protein